MQKKYFISLFFKHKLPHCTNKYHLKTLTCFHNFVTLDQPIKLDGKQMDPHFQRNSLIITKLSVIFLFNHSFMTPGRNLRIIFNKGKCFRVRGGGTLCNVYVYFVYCCFKKEEKKRIFILFLSMMIFRFCCIMGGSIFTEP